MSRRRLAAGVSPSVPPNKEVDFDRKSTSLFYAVKPLIFKAFSDIGVCVVPLSARFRGGILSFSEYFTAPLLR